MKPFRGHLAIVSVAGFVGLGLGACGQGFSAGGSSGGNDGGGSSDGGSPGDASGLDGTGGGGDATTDATKDAAADVKTGDVVVSEGSTIDAGALCHGAFAAPTPVLAHTSAYYVDSFTLTPGELEAFVALQPTGAASEQRAVYELHRTHPGDAFVLDTSEPIDLTNTGPTPGAFDVALGPDGLALYFSHRQDSDAGLLGIDIYEAQRANPSSSFNGGSAFGPAINDPTTTQFHAHPGGPDLYFTVAPLISGVQGQRDLYPAPLAGGPRVPIAELNGATTQEQTPVPSGDELELFFSSDRANPGAFSQVYAALRTSPALVFSTIALVPLTLVNPSSNVTPQFLTADRCRLYVLVDQQDVYVSQRAP